MAKKHRLDIPEKMLRWICPELREMQGKTQSSWHDDIHELGWLTEIKEQLTVEEAWEKYLGSEDSMDDDDETIYKSAWGDCLENQKLGQVGDEEKMIREAC